MNLNNQNQVSGSYNQSQSKIKDTNFTPFTSVVKDLNKKESTGNQSLNLSTLEAMKERLYDELCRGILEAINRGEASLLEGKQSAKFILDYLDNVQTKDELLQFLYDLATRWKVYHPFYIKTRYQLEEEAEKEKIEKLKKHLYQFYKN